MPTLTLTAADGHTLAAYRATPPAAPIGGLVVIQEIFGVNSHIRAVADGYAADGFDVIAPALFDRVEPGIELGYEPADIEAGRAIRAKIAFDDGLRDVAAAVKALADDGLSPCVVGYCWGGSLAWAAATRLDGVTAVSSYYGGDVPKLADETLRCPVILHFGETDASIPLDGVEQVRAKHPDLPLHIYPAGHGFSCDQRGSYDAPSTELARTRTLEFLKSHL